MRKCSVVLLVFFMLLFSGCGKMEETVLHSTVVESTSKEEVPIVSDNQKIQELEKLNEFYQLQVLQLILEKSDEEIEENLRETITQWGELQNYFDITSIVVNCTADPLLMVEGSNQKAISNMTLRADIHFVEDSFTGKSYEEMGEDFYDALSQNIYYLHKLSTVDVRFYHEKGYELHHLNYNTTQTLSTHPGMGQTESLFALQTIAFDFVENLNATEFSDDDYIPHGNVTLRHFGIEEEGQLYLEIPIFEVDYEVGVETYLEKLEQEHGPALVAQLKEGGSAQLEENGIGEITIEFVTMWAEENPLIVNTTL